MQYKRAVTNNRRRTKTAKNKRLQRQRSEKVERSFAHVCETGGARRAWLRGLEKVRKRYLMSAVARNLGLLMRKLFGIGTARGLQGQGGFADAIYLPWLHILTVSKNVWFVVARSLYRSPDQRPSRAACPIAA